MLQTCVVVSEEEADSLARDFMKHRKPSVNSTPLKVSSRRVPATTATSAFTGKRRYSSSWWEQGWWDGFNSDVWSLNVLSLPVMSTLLSHTLYLKCESVGEWTVINALCFVLQEFLTIENGVSGWEDESLCTIRFTHLLRYHYCILNRLHLHLHLIFVLFITCSNK